LALQLTDLIPCINFSLSGIFLSVCIPAMSDNDHDEGDNEGANFPTGVGRGAGRGRGRGAGVPVLPSVRYFL
jgi:hypothetical protein